MSEAGNYLGARLRGRTIDDARAEILAELDGEKLELDVLTAKVVAEGLATLAGPHEAVICHEHAHIATDEAGAPGFFGAGLGLIPLPGPSGRINPAALTHGGPADRPAGASGADGKS